MAQCWIAWSMLNCCPDCFQRCREIALLAQYRPEQMKGLDVAGLGMEHTPVDCFGFPQSSRLVQRAPGIEWTLGH